MTAMPRATQKRDRPSPRAGLESLCRFWGRQGKRRILAGGGRCLEPALPGLQDNGLNASGRAVRFGVVAPNSHLGGGYGDNPARNPSG
jgi:hypothetical protein